MINKVKNMNIVKGTMGDVDIRLTNMVIIANNTLKYGFTFLSPFE